MTRFLKTLAVVLGAGAITALGIFSIRALLHQAPTQQPQQSQKNLNGAGYGPVRTSYDLIGTAASPSRLSTSYAINSSTLRAPNLENLHLDIQYTSASSGKYAYILVEGSNDGGTTFYPIGTKNVASNQVNVYGVDLDGNYGMPIIFPGAATSTSSTVYKAGVDFDMVADTVRVSAKESAQVSSSLYVRGTVTSP